MRGKGMSRVGVGMWAEFPWHLLGHTQPSWVLFLPLSPGVPSIPPACSISESLLWGRVPICSCLNPLVPRGEASERTLWGGQEQQE